MMTSREMAASLLIQPLGRKATVSDTVTVHWLGGLDNVNFIGKTVSAQCPGHFNW